MPPSIHEPIINPTIIRINNAPQTFAILVAISFIISSYEYPRKIACTPDTTAAKTIKGSAGKSKNAIPTPSIISIASIGNNA